MKPNPGAACVLRERNKTLPKLRESLNQQTVAYLATGNNSLVRKPYEKKRER